MSQIVLTTDTLGTTTAGALEYASPVIYGTPVGDQRGVIPNSQFYRLDTNLAGANATGAQNTFGVSVSLSASTVYAFEQYAVLSKTAGATGHTVGFGFGGTATVNNILFSVIGGDGGALPTAANTATFLSSNTVSNTVLTGSSTSAARTVTARMKGTINANAAGTFTPQYTLSAAPGGAYSTVAGSYFLIYPIGSAGLINVGTWA